MANNRHFYGAGVLPRSMAQKLEEKLNSKDFWNLLVKPFERLCSMKEACEKSDYFLGEFEEAAQEAPDEDVVLFVCEGWDKYGFDADENVSQRTFFLTQTEFNDGFELIGGWDTYTDDDYEFGSKYVSELDGNNSFGFAQVDGILSEIKPDFPTPRFHYLSDEELTDDYSNTMFLNASISVEGTNGTPQKVETTNKDFEIKDGVLVKYKGEGGDVAIPEGVTAIGNYAFSGCTSLTSVAIPEGVTEIGGNAFRNCKSLASVVIPEGVTEIGKSAFEGCSSLASVVIPEGVTEIGEKAFFRCAFPEDFKAEAAGWRFENSLAIKDGVVDSCTNQNAEKIAIPEGVTAIGYYAFICCSSLASVAIPEGVTKIGDSAFHACDSLTSVAIPESVTEIGDGAFKSCESLASVVIPECVTEIGDKAFSGCKSLKQVTVPASATIGDGAFPEDCEVVKK